MESVPGQGSEFTVTLPVVHAAKEREPGIPERKITDGDISAELAAAEEPAATGTDDRPLLLIIDDNPDIRAMVRELLGDDYSAIEAGDGKEGMRLAAKYVPDLIICDVMMPGVDGLECCRNIKGELSTSHIPVLMLTACSMDEQRIQGYESGADGYLSKPFSARMLRMRCRNLIENRRRIKNLLKPGAENVDSNRPAPGGDMDNEFYSRFLSLVSAKMGNPDLNIDSIAAELGLGRSQFYRKIKSLTNYSPVELLRKLRLEKARELLASTSRTISEIAYEVGFTAPAYFTRVYREAYGETPTALRSRLGMV